MKQTMREKIIDLIYGTRANTTLTEEQIDWANKTVDALLSTIRKSLPKKKMHSEYCHHQLGSHCDCGSNDFNVCIDDIKKLLE